jgi:hypothetical protein
MDVRKMLVELRRELDILNATIASLERFEVVGPREKGPRIHRAPRPTIGKGGAQAEGTPKAK